MADRLERIDMNKDVKYVNGKLAVRKEKVDALCKLFTSRIIEKRKKELKNKPTVIELSQI
jgi:uncharacterized protein (UPF0305 family)